MKYVRGPSRHSRGSCGRKRRGRERDGEDRVMGDPMRDALNRIHEDLMRATATKADWSVCAGAEGWSAFRHQFCSRDMINPTVTGVRAAVARWARE